MRLVRWLSAAIASVILGTGMALALPEDESVALTEKLSRLEAALIAETGSPLTPLSRLVDTAGLADLVGPQDRQQGRTVPDWFATAPGAAEVQRMNMRLVLTMLAQAYGGEDNASVLSAQTGAELDALVIREGQVTLADLRGLLKGFRLQRDGEGKVLTLRVPLVIWAGAALQLQPGEVLELSRSDGAFVVNFGLLSAQGATIRSVGTANPASKSFVPFVTSADGGVLHLKGAVVEGLGFGGTAKFSGLAILGSVLRGGGQPDRIEDSLIRNLQTVTVSNATDAILRGNRFQDMRSAALVLVGGRRASVESNVFFGAMPTNAIRMEGGAAEGRIAGNIVLGGERAGIVVRGGSRAVRVEQNIVWHRSGGGITLAESDCGLIRDNLVIANAQKGIEVRTSTGSDVQGNTVLANRSAGIWVSAQPPGTQTLLQGNIIAANGSGLSAADGENILLDGNDFTRQFPKFTGGDLTLQSTHIALNMQGKTPFVLTAGGIAEPAPSSSACSD